MAISYEELGLTKEEFQDRVVQGAVEYLMSEDDAYSHALKRLRDESKKGIDAAVTKLANEAVMPGIEQMVRDCALQETNKWGEKIGKSLTFTEYLVSRADHYMRENVNSEFKSKEESDSYWKSQGPRVSMMVKKHLQDEIAAAMKAAFENLNTSVAKGLHAAVAAAINETLAKLKAAAPDAGGTT